MVPIPVPTTVTAARELKVSSDVDPYYFVKFESLTVIFNQN